MIESLIDPVRTWVRTIAVIIVLAGFIEILVPKSSMARYVRMVMGLVILLAVLNPLVSLLRQPLGVPDFWEVAAETQARLGQAREEDYAEITRQQMVQAYRRKLEDYVALVARSAGEDPQEVQVSFVDELDREDFGRLTGVEVILRGVERVEEVRIDPSGSPVQKEGPQDAVAAAIKEEVARSLGLVPEEVQIVRK